MINFHDFVKKNDKENFKYCCSELNQMLEGHLEKLQDLRQTLYKCVNSQCQKLQDSQLQNDVILINELISITKSIQKKKVFSGTISCFMKYKEEFTEINYIITNQLTKLSTNQMRKFSINMKMYENVIEKRNILIKFYNSLDDLDSPVKIRQDVFTF
ncbi:hypothetical protein ABPG74_014698 [Tetrahymena malaccensis]